MSNVKPGMYAVVIDGAAKGCVVHVDEVSDLATLVYGKLSWNTTMLSFGWGYDANSVKCAVDCGDKLFCTDDALRPLNDPGPEITTERETEVTV